MQQAFQLGLKLAGRYREIQGDGDTGRYREIQGDVGRFREI